MLVATKSEAEATSVAFYEDIDVERIKDFDRESVRVVDIKVRGVCAVRYALS